MSLPASGQISIGNIRTELSNTGTAPFSLASAGCVNGTARESGYTPLNQNSTSKPNTSTPYQVSEWYSYNHSQNGSCGTNYTTPSIVYPAPYIYYRISVAGTVGQKVRVAFTANSVVALDGETCYIYNTYPFTNTGSLTGTPLSTITTFTSGTTYYIYTLVGTSDVLYFVIRIAA